MFAMICPATYLTAASATGWLPLPAHTGSASTPRLLPQPPDRRDDHDATIGERNLVLGLER